MRNAFFSWKTIDYFCVSLDNNKEIFSKIFFICHINEVSLLKNLIYFLAMPGPGQSSPRFVLCSDIINLISSIMRYIKITRAHAPCLKCMLLIRGNCFFKSLQTLMYDTGGRDFWLFACWVERVRREVTPSVTRAGTASGLIQKLIQDIITIRHVGM